MRFLKPTLGELEIQILETFWSDAKDWDVKGMHSHISQFHQVTHNTVQSTMERLYRKGFLDRTKVSHAYLYCCTKSREEFLGETMQVFMEEMNVDEETFISAFLKASSKKNESTYEEMMKKVKRAFDKFRGKN